MSATLTAKNLKRVSVIILALLIVITMQLWLTVLAEGHFLAHLCDTDIARHCGRFLHHRGGEL